MFRHLRWAGRVLTRTVRFREASGEPRLGLVELSATTVSELVNADIVEVLRGDRRTSGRTLEALDPETLELPPPFQLLIPLVPPETWAAGVTYERSREARVDESRVEARDVYSLVYEAERPELFLKDVYGRRTVGPGGTVGVRSDAEWTVPEPEVALVLGEDGELLGATIGNDVTARDVEGANPLYLPQAKVFAGACALGPAIAAPDGWPEPFEIELQIVGADGDVLFEGQTSTAKMRRTFTELAAWTVRENPVPAGSVLLTGTGLVPPDDVALRPGHHVEIRIPGIGKLVNPVGAAADLLPAERSTNHVR
jgi:2-dehydro-3-deoxy-D-arabinonate dehydratase